MPAEEDSRFHGNAIRVAGHYGEKHAMTSLPWAGKNFIVY
jgi:hypothetical protein